MRFVICVLLLVSMSALAQNQELAFTLGGTTNDLGGVKTSSGKSLQVNYGYRLLGNALLSVSGEFHFLANSLRNVTGGPTATRDFASLYLTPGVRIKLNPNGRIEPFGLIGGGYALYEQSTETVAGTPNPAPRHINRGAFTYGGGLDVKVVRWLALRGDLRDFYTGRPALNLLTAKGGQHNVVASGGFVFRWGK